jgi:hypothetical protein
MAKHIKTKPMRDIEKAAKAVGLEVEFVNCKKHVQVFINKICVMAISNSRVDQTHNHRQIFSIIQKMAA